MLLGVYKFLTNLKDRTYKYRRHPTTALMRRSTAGKVHRITAGGCKMDSRFQTKDF